MTQPLNENQLFMSTVTRVNCNLKCYMIVVLLKKKKRGGGRGGETRECGEKPVEQGLETTKKWY